MEAETATKKVQQQQGQCRGRDSSRLHQSSFALPRHMSWVLAAAVLLGWAVTFYTIVLLNRRGQHLSQQQQRQAVINGLLPVSCTPTAFAKQSCRFSQVCLQAADSGSSGNTSLRATLWGSWQPQHVTLLQQHLQRVIAGHFKLTDCQAAPPPPAGAWPTFDDRPAVLWRNYPGNTFSFGHALVTEAFPLFNMLQDHLGPASGDGDAIPASLQLLVMGLPGQPLLNVLKGTITSNLQQLGPKLEEQATRELCFSQLILGDGGYARAGLASLANSPGAVSRVFGEHPSFFTSSNWFNFRQHTLKVNQIEPGELTAAKPLILLNDKRYGKLGAPDRRMILDVDALAANISALYRMAEVRAVRFRDLPFADQVRWLARSKVFITTQASSSFGLVFLPRGATCIMIGAPEATNATAWKSFYELDHWFPLAYAQILRYEVPVQHEDEYQVRVLKGWWQPKDEKEVRNWWLYNADVRVDVQRLRHMLDPIILGIDA